MFPTVGPAAVRNSNQSFRVGEQTKAQSSVPKGLTLNWALIREATGGVVGLGPGRDRAIAGAVL